MVSKDMINRREDRDNIALNLLTDKCITQEANFNIPRLNIVLIIWLINIICDFPCCKYFKQNIYFFLWLKKNSILINQTMNGLLFTFSLVNPKCEFILR